MFEWTTGLNSGITQKDNFGGSYSEVILYLNGSTDTVLPFGFVDSSGGGLVNVDLSSRKTWAAIYFLRT